MQDVKWDIGSYLDLKEIRRVFPELLNKDNFWKELLMRDYNWSTVDNSKNIYKYLTYLKQTSKRIGKYIIQKEVLEYIILNEEKSEGFFENFIRYIKKYLAINTIISYKSLFDYYNIYIFSEDNKLVKLDFDICNIIHKKDYYNKTLYFYDGKTTTLNYNLMLISEIIDEIYFIRESLSDNLNFNHDELNIILYGLIFTNCPLFRKLIDNPESYNQSDFKHITKYLSGSSNIAQYLSDLFDDLDKARKILKLRFI